MRSFISFRLERRSARRFLHRRTDNFSSGRYSFLAPLLAEVVTETPLSGDSEHFLIDSLSQGNRTLELISMVTAEDFAGGDVVCAMSIR